MDITNAPGVRALTCSEGLAQFCSMVLHAVVACAVRIAARMSCATLWSLTQRIHSFGRFECDYVRRWDDSHDTSHESAWFQYRGRKVQGSLLTQLTD